MAIETNTDVACPAVADNTSLGPNLQPLGALVASELEADIGSPAALLASLIGEVPEYARLDEADRGRLRDHVVGTAAIFVNAFGDDRPLRDDELAALETVGAEQVELGASLRALVDGLRIGRRELLRRIDEAVHRARERDITDILRVVRQALDQFDATAGAILEGYRRARAVSAADARLALLEALLRSDSATSAGIIERSRALGWELTNPLGALLVTALGDGTSAVDSVNTALATFTKRRQDTLGTLTHTTPRLHGVVVLPAPTPRAWRAALADAAAVARDHRTIFLAVGPVAHPGQLAPAFAESRRNLSLATRVTEEPTVLTADDLVVYRMVAEWSPSVRQMLTGDAVTRLLALPVSRRTRLETAAWALFRTNESYTDAAGLLGITAKAVRKRIETLSAATGLSFARANDRFRLWLVLHHLRLTDGRMQEVRGREGTFSTEIFPDDT